MSENDVRIEVYKLPVGDGIDQYAFFNDVVLPKITRVGPLRPRGRFGVPMGRGFYLDQFGMTMDWARIWFGKQVERGAANWKDVRRWYRGRQKEKVIF